MVVNRWKSVERMTALYRRIIFAALIATCQSYSDVEALSAHGELRGKDHELCFS